MSVQQQDNNMETSNGKYVFAYTRISSANAKKSSNGNSISIEQQREIITNFASYSGVNIDEYIEETGSVYTKKTVKLLDALNRLSNLAQCGYDTVLFVYSVDRFSRNYVNGMKMLTLALENNINIVFINDELQTNEKDDIPRIFAKLGRAEDEAKMISNRIKDRCKYNKQRGWQFGRAEYGMKSMMRDGIRQFIPDKYEKDVIRFIMYATKPFTDTIRFNTLFMKVVTNTAYHSDIVVFDNIIRDEPIILSNSNIAELLNEYEVYKRGKQWNGSMINRIKKERYALTDTLVNGGQNDPILID